MKKAPLKPKNVISAIMVCTALSLAGIGYIWAKIQVVTLSKDMKKLELRLEELKRKNEILQQTYAAMCTPARLDESVKRLKLGLAAPRIDQIVRLTEPPAPEPSAAEQKVYAKAE